MVDVDVCCGEYFFVVVVLDVEKFCGEWSMVVIVDHGEGSDCFDVWIFGSI